MNPANTAENLDIQSILAWGAKQLLHSETPRLDAEILLCFVLNVERSYLYAWRDKIVSKKQYVNYQSFILRRANGEPIAYLTGNKSFWSLDVNVNSATLIPRPETELLVEQALAHLPVQHSGVIIDLGTGSGAIALSLAKERQNYQIIATDFAINALIVAQLNARRLNLKNIQFLTSNWFSALGKMQAKLILSNPPYIAENDEHLLKDGVKYEPRTALVSKNNGLADLQHIIEQAQCYLIEKGWLLVEHGYQQSEAVQAFFKKQGYSCIETYRDLAGLPRVTVGQK